MTQENHNNAEKFLRKKYPTANEASQFGFNEVVSILAEYTNSKGSALHEKAISKITPKERELQVSVLHLTSTLHKLQQHNANYFGDSVMREIIENALNNK